jgi:hypothetical protein
MDPILNWLNGLSAFMVVIGAWLYAILNIRRYLKGKLKSTLYMTILFIAVAFGWTGITLSLFSVLFFGSTLPEVAAIISYFSYCTIPIGSCAVILISWDQLFTPKHKKVGFGIFGILYAIYYIFLFMTWSRSVENSYIPGSGQIFDDWLSWTSVPFWMIWLIVGAAAVLWTIGLNLFRNKSEGEIRRRTNFLSLSSLFIGGAILLDTVIFTGAFVEFAWIARLMMIPAIYTGYIGLKPI